MWKIIDKKVVRMMLMITLLCSCLCMGVETYAKESDLPDIVEPEGVIYALEDWASENISIPSEYPQSFQIQVLNATDVYYEVISGESVEVSDTGLVTPHITTYYWQDMGNYSIGTTEPKEGVEYTKITNEITYGTSIIEVVADDEIFEVTVELCDYAIVYSDKVIDSYIADNFTDDMTLEETLNKICELPASYDYSDKHLTYYGMIVSGGGDCWASTGLILELCERLNIDAKARNGNRDIGAGYGHMNVLVTNGDGDYYELDAGYSQEAPRYYSVTHRTSLFSYYFTMDGISVYQYDGDITKDTILEVPETIDSYTVVGIGDDFISQENACEVILPNTIKTIGQSAFNSCVNLKTIHIPASVLSIGSFAFTNCNALTEFTCSEDNTVYKIENGILYSKNGATLIHAPSCETATVSEETDTIGYYSFYYNDNVTEIILPENVKSLSEGALGSCHSLKKVVFKGVEDIGEYALAHGQLSDGVFFEGDAPNFSDTSFYYATATVYYPAGNDTWTDDIMQNYGGSITWISYVPGADGVCKVDGIWGYYKEGLLQNDYTGIEKNKYGWWYIKNGKVDFKYTGLAKNKYGWWYIKNGKVDFEYTGLAKNKYGWWYIKNGKVDFEYTGLAKNKYGWWYIKNGKVDFEYTGMANNKYGWWYITDGKLDLTYTGLATNSRGTWYYQKGKLDLTYTGTVTIGGVSYSIENGKVK